MLQEHVSRNITACSLVSDGRGEAATKPSSTVMTVCRLQWQVAAKAAKGCRLHEAVATVEVGSRLQLPK